MTDRDYRSWHGWRLPGNDGIHVGPLPGRRQIVLYRERDNTIVPLAYFKTEAQAREALFLLDRLARGRPS